MGALIGLIVGIGLCLIFFACTAATSPATSTRGSATVSVERPKLRWRPGLVAGCLLLGSLTTLVVLVVTQALPVAISFGALSVLGPVWWHQGRERRRATELAAVWPEAVDNLASAVRAGMSLPDAVAGLSSRGPEVLRPAFAQFAADYQLTGRFSESLDSLKDALADPTGDRVVEGLRIAREVGGGDLGRLLRHLSGYLRDEARTRSELEARQSWTINGARLAVVAPWLVLGFLSFQPEVLRAYDSPGGATVLAVGAVSSVVAYAAMMRVGRLPRPRRVLR